MRISHVLRDLDRNVIYICIYVYRDCHNRSIQDKYLVSQFTQSYTLKNFTKMKFKIANFFILSHLPIELISLPKRDPLRSSIPFDKKEISRYLDTPIGVSSLFE